MEIIFLLLQTVIASITSVLFYQTLLRLKETKHIAKQIDNTFDEIKKAHNTNADTIERIVVRMQDIELMLAVTRKERGK